MININLWSKEYIEENLTRVEILKRELNAYLRANI